MPTPTDPPQPNPDLAPLVDSHAHLDSEDYDADRDAVVDRARRFGLKAIITIGIEPADWQNTLAIAALYTDIYPALGIHPNSADQTTDATLEQVAQLCKANHVIGLGETGLDYYREYVSHEQQKDSFRQHLALSRELDLPVIIHTRDAYDGVLEILRKDGKGTRGVMHSFSGDMACALECIGMGYMISLSGPVTFRKATDKHTLARDVPLDSLMVETDCPYLTPAPYRGRRNEPAYVAYTAKAIAELRGMPLAELAKATTRNTARLFGLQLE